MKTGVLLLSFGEPTTTSPLVITAFLERIFAFNAPLMGNATPEQVAARSRALAEERAPGLIEEYERIGGSPLHRQAREQADALELLLQRRGLDASAFLGMQFTEPSIPDAVAAAREAGAGRLVALPVYPLTGPSTTLAALDAVDRAVEDAGWDVPVHRLSGWHRHPGYLRLRADAVRMAMAGEGVSLDDPRTRLVFSAHGTPLKYLEEGSRYDVYVRDFCARLAGALGGVPYVIGYQNHSNRPGVRWTQPETEQVIREIDADTVVVDAVSFMHEQSETLAELDLAMRAAAEARGLRFVRVPIPYAAPGFIEVLADLVEPFGRRPADGTPAPGEAGLQPCGCVPARRAYCLNAAVHGPAPPRAAAG